MSAVLDAITSATGIVFDDESRAACELVDIRFDFIALDRALAQVLRGRSYIVRTGDDGKLVVWLLPPGQGERLTDTDTELEAFYANMKGNRLTEDLANQIERVDAVWPGSGQRPQDDR